MNDSGRFRIVNTVDVDLSLMGFSICTPRDHSMHRTSQGGQDLPAICIGDRHHHRRRGLLEASGRERPEHHITKGLPARGAWGRASEGISMGDGRLALL